ncbi:ABC transporter permease [Patulibacter defluvii]|uniref:ABC transporter permease n=1 Tax=Patulibacter defluvii TaxID=3095358 RepID=UPI002A75B043|nr:ABC transporter permease [Patulibacter sp. DM4]
MSSTLTALPSPAASGSTRTSYLDDVRTVFLRELRPLLREPFTLVFGMIQPLFFLALFGPLLVSTSGLGEAATLQWFVPGILVMSVLFATSTTGANLLQEIQTGSHERMLVTPLRRSSLIVGRALKEIVPVLGQALLIVLVALPFGFDPHPTALLGLLLVAAFGVGLGALSYSLALVVKDQDWIFWMVQQTFLFPLMLLSGMLLPLDDGPGWLKALSDANPLKYLVDAERALFAGDVGVAAVAWGAIAAVAVGLAGLALGVRTIRRSADA